MDLHAENGALAPIIQTERLTLRPLAPGDDAAVVAALSNWDIVKWLTAVPWPYSLDDAVYFRTHIAAHPDHPHWAIDDGTGLIGVISVKPDMGYWLASGHHGKGIMTEAATAIVADAFAGGRSEIISGHLIGNVPSRAILTRLGFKDTHMTTAAHCPSGTTVPLQRMALQAGTWAARHD
jgi:RimJ/RimL family protein N-acetyltransferase